jgi:hypothetical protein
LRLLADEKIQRTEIAQKMKKIIYFPPTALTIDVTMQNATVDFKTGKFKFDYRSKVSKTTLLNSVKLKTLKEKTASIRWVNDCEYVLLKLHPKNNEEEKKLWNENLDNYKNSYTFEFGMVGSDAKQRGTVTKITD